MKPSRNNKRQISVWGVSKIYAPLYSGAAIQAQRLYSALAGDEFRFTVLTARYGEVKARPRIELIERVRVCRLPILPDSLGIHWLDSLWKRQSDLCFAIGCILMIFKRRSQINLLHIQYSASVSRALVVIAASLLHIPTLVRLTMLKPASLNSRGYIYPYLEKWAFSRVDRITALSQTMAHQLEKAGLESTKLEVVPQGVDTSIFYPISEPEQVKLRQQLQLDPRGTYIIFVGIIYHRKGVDILVRAFVEAAKHCSDLRMILVGQRDFSKYPVPEEERARLNQFCADLQAELEQYGLADRVTWTGKLKPKDVVSYLQAADIFCFPSRLEGVASSMLEAMACGLPIVASSLQGTSAEIISHSKEGFIVESGKAGDYATFIERLAVDKSLAREMGRLGHQRIEQEFSLNRAAERYISLFRTLGCS